MTHTMRAAVVAAYGGPEQIRIETPPIPRPAKGEVLIRVRTTTVSSGDRRIRARDFPPGMGLPVRLALGWSGPRQPVLGVELCGEVAAVGPGVTILTPGQPVVAATGMRMGAHAEYCLLPDSAAIIPRPDGLTDAEAAAMVFGGTAALTYLRDKARLRAGDRLLILGATGTVGTAAVQVARAMGAEVWAQGRAERHETLRALGADHVLDRRAQDYRTLGPRWDVILDTIGAEPLPRLRGALAERGRLLLLNATLAQMFLPLGNAFRHQRILSGPVADRRDDLVALAEMVAAGQFRPVIDSTYPLARIAEAHARVDRGDKFGSVVVAMQA